MEQGETTTRNGPSGPAEPTDGGAVRARASRGARALFVAAAFVVVVAGMRAAQPILVPFLLALFLSVLCGPALAALHRLGLPLVVSLGVVIGGLAVFGLLVAGLVGSSARDFERSLPELRERMSSGVESFQGWLVEQGLMDAHAGGAPPDHEDPSASPEAAAPRRRDVLALVEVFDAGAVFSHVNDLLGQLLALLADTFLILLTVVFMLLEAVGFPDKLRRALDDPWVSFAPFNRFIDSVNRYMAMKTAVSLLTGVLAGGWLALLGIDYPLLWGLLAFLLNFVPNLGSLIAAVPPVLLALIQADKGPGSALLVALGYGAINGIVGNLLEPRLMGRRLGLSTLVVFLSLVFWGWILGPVGMLLSVPLTMTVKIALESYEDTRWLSVLLGSDTRPPATPRREDEADEAAT